MGIENGLSKVLFGLSFQIRVLEYLLNGRFTASSSKIQFSWSVPWIIHQIFSCNLQCLLTGYLNCLFNVYCFPNTEKCSIILYGVMLFKWSWYSRDRRGYIISFVSEALGQHLVILYVLVFCLIVFYLIINKRVEKYSFW